MGILKQINCKIHGWQDRCIGINDCPTCVMKYIEARKASLDPVIAAIESVQNKGDIK